MVIHGVVASEGTIAVLALHSRALWVMDLHVADELVGSVEVLVANNTCKLLLYLSLFVDVHKSLKIYLPPLHPSRGTGVFFVITDGMRKGVDSTGVTTFNEAMEVASSDVLLRVVAEVLKERSSILELDPTDLAGYRRKLPSGVALSSLDWDSLYKQTVHTCAHKGWGEDRWLQVHTVM